MVNYLLSFQAGDFVSRPDLQKQLFNFLYEQGITHIPNKGCKTCIARAYAALHRFARNHKNQPNMTGKKIYTMKRGVKYRPPGWDFILTHENCTQELAEKALARNPNCIIYFDYHIEPEAKPEAPKAEPKPTTKKRTKK